MQLKSVSLVQTVQLPEVPPQLVETLEPTTALECNSKTA